MKNILYCRCCLISSISFLNTESRLSADKWVDSVFNSLTPDQRIAQLMVIRAHSNLGADHVAKVTNDIQQYNVGALCFSRADQFARRILPTFTKALQKRH